MNRGHRVTKRGAWVNDLHWPEEASGDSPCRGNCASSLREPVTTGSIGGTTAGTCLPGTARRSRFKRARGADGELRRRGKPARRHRPGLCGEVGRPRIDSLTRSRQTPLAPRLGRWRAGQQAEIFFELGVALGQPCHDRHVVAKNLCDGALSPSAQRAPLSRPQLHSGRALPRTPLDVRPKAHLTDVRLNVRCRDDLDFRDASSRAALPTC